MDEGQGEAEHLHVGKEVPRSRGEQLAPQGVQGGPPPSGLHLVPGKQGICPSHGEITPS